MSDTQANETPTEKIPLVLWSGGLDSTYLLWCSLHYTAVDTLSVELTGKVKLAPEKMLMEKLSRVNIGTWLEDRYHTADSEIKHLIRNEIEVAVSGETFSDPFRGNVQSFAWMTAALTKVDPDKHSEVAIAYVADDNATRKAEDLKTLWEIFWRWQRPETPAVPLVFPLLEPVSYNKWNILDRIPARLVCKIWVCELPTQKLRPCKKCSPCITWQKALLEYELCAGESYGTRYLRDLNPGLHPVRNTDT